MIRELFLRDLSLWTCLWQSSVFAALGLIAGWLLRRRPARAYQALLLAMTTAVAVPLLSAVVKYSDLGAFVASPTELSYALPEMPFAMPDAVSHAGVTQPAPPQSMPAGVVEPAALRIPWQMVLRYGWLAMTLALLGRLFATFLYGVHLVRHASRVPCDRVQRAVDSAESKLAVSWVLKVRASRRIHSPLVWCWSRPSILLVPDPCDDAQVDWGGVVAHELAHCRRRDHITGLVAELAASLMPWNPLMWLSRRMLIRLGEQACDDWVVASGQSSEDYAESLLHFRPQKQPAFWPAVVSSQGGLAHRIRRILNDACGNPRAGARWALTLGLVAIVAGLGVAFAQTRPAVPEASVKPKELPALHGTEQPLALPVSLAEFPRTLNGWTGTDMFIPPETEQYLRANYADDFISRRYTNASGGQGADLYVVRCSSRPSGMLDHSPKTCFPAHGWIWDQTVPARIVTASNRLFGGDLHTFHLPPTQARMTVLCFYVMDNRILNEQDLSLRLARETLQGSPRYAAMVQIASPQEDSVRAAAGAMIDALAEVLAVRRPSPIIVGSAPEQPPAEEVIDKGGTQPSHLAAQPFNSEIAFDVFVQETPALVVDPERGATEPQWIGRTPSAAPLEIPAGWIWWVFPSTPVADWDALVRELDRNKVPGFRLPTATDADIKHLARLTGVRYLDLISAQITDAGLAQLAGLTQLEWLNLPGAGVTDAGLMHLRGLTELRRLNLHRTQITNAGLAHLKGLTELEALDLSTTWVTGSGLASLHGMAKLQQLNLCGSAVAEQPLQSLGNLTGLKVLDLSLTRVTDADLVPLENLTELRRLDLSHTWITDVGLVHLQGLTALQHLQMGGNAITDAGLERLAGLTQLQQLHLSKTQVTDAGLERLKALTELERLDLSGSRITGPGLAHLERLTKLQSLSLDGTPITGPGLEHLKALTELRCLTLRESQITDGDLAYLEGMTKLQILALTGTQITDAGLAHLKSLTGLEGLGLSSGRITDQGLEHLKNLPNLKQVNFDGHPGTWPVAKQRSLLNKDSQGKTGEAVEGLARRGRVVPPGERWFAPRTSGFETRPYMRL